MCEIQTLTVPQDISRDSWTTTVKCRYGNGVTRVSIVRSSVDWRILSSVHMNSNTLSRLRHVFCAQSPPTGQSNGVTIGLAPVCCASRDTRAEARLGGHLSEFLLVCLSVSLLLASVGPVVAPAAAQQGSAPSIDVAIDGEPVADGGDHSVQSDPTANVTVESNGTISLVEIRVDGDIRHSYRPENRSFSRAVPLELGLNDNTVEVIAGGERVSTFKATVTKRTGAPRVKYTSPFTTTVKGGQPDKTTVPTGEVTIAGSLHTVSTVDRVTIERTFVHDLDDGSNETDRELYRIDDPGEEFSQDLRLGVGENEVAMTYVDSSGKTNTDEFTLVVNDETAPTIDLDAPNVSYRNSAQIRVSATDETKLDRVAIEHLNTSESQVLLPSTNPEPDMDRLNVSVSTHVTLYHTDEPNEFRLIVEDTAGNTNEQEFAVEHDPNPQVAILTKETNATAGTAHVAGNITEADMTRVTLETIHTDSGERLDIERIHETTDPAKQVAFNRTLAAAPGQTVANLIVTYDGGKQYTTSITPRVDESTEPRENGSESDNSSDDDGNKTDDATAAIENPETDNGEPAAGDGDAEPNGDTTGESPADTDGSGDDDSDSGGGFLPALLGVGTRETLGGVMLVGSVYLLGIRI